MDDEWLSATLDSHIWDGNGTPTPEATARASPNTTERDPNEQTRPVGRFASDGAGMIRNGFGDRVGRT